MDDLLGNFPEIQRGNLSVDMLSRVIDTDSTNLRKTIEKVTKEIIRSNGKLDEDQVRYSVYRYYKLKSGIYT
jgi:hypothetical protein